jgi:LysR family transcriptional regulator for bpeEF and oprC
MHAFVRVVEHGAFGRAADDLGISRASITQAVGQLEKRLGVRLLNRTTRRLSLTDEGRGFYNDCLAVLGQIAEAEDRLSGTRLAPRGQLRVSVPQSFSERILLPALRDFMQRYPELSVELIITDRAVNLIEEGIDCALRGIELPPDSGLVARKLCSASWLTCASPGYLEANDTPVSIADLAHHECVRFISPSTGRGRDWMFVMNGKLETVVPYGRLRLTSLTGALDAALAGFGIAQVPDAVAYQSIVDGDLRPLLTDYVAPAPSLLLVYPGNRYLTAKVRAFSDFSTAAFPADGWWSLLKGEFSRA